MTNARFTGQVLGGHKQAAIEVPFDPGKQWGLTAAKLWAGRRGYKVRGSFADVSFQSVVVPRAKRFWVLIDEEHLKAAGVSVGDSVSVLLEPVTP
jgi:Domain of unknown function (DUF1905)